MEELNEPLSKAIIRFIEDHPPKTMKRNLFSLFVDYIYTLNHSIGFQRNDSPTFHPVEQILKLHEKRCIVLKNAERKG